MAHRLVAIAPSRLAGSAALALVLALTLGSLAAVAATGGMGRLGAADWAAARFTLWQAFLSTVLSLALAVPVARALARRAFPGRRAFVAALGAPFLLPVIVAVMALLSVFGRNGLVSSGLAALGLGPFSIYGLSGILLAHVFLNLPLALRMLLHGWEAIPAERFRLAASLDALPGATWRLVERPMLAANLPGAGLAILLICLSSFTVVLVLGGGPRATTLELALYQAFRMEFDLAHAGALGLLQAALALAAAALGLWLVPAVQPGAAWTARSFGARATGRALGSPTRPGLRRRRRSLRCRWRRLSRAACRPWRACRRRSGPPPPAASRLPSVPR